MVRLSDLAQAERDHLINLPCPTFDTQPWAEGPPISKRRVAVISTAGLQRRARGVPGGKVLPARVASADGSWLGAGSEGPPRVPRRLRRARDIGRRND